MLLAYFSVSGPTILALTALAAALPQPWWQYAGYSSAFDPADLANAGGLS